MRNPNKIKYVWNFWLKVLFSMIIDTVKLGNKKRLDKEQIGIKEPFSVTNLPFTS